MKLIFAQIVDTAAITALIAANPIAALILGAGTAILLYTYRANIKSLIDNKTWNPPAADPNAPVVNVAAGSAPTTISATAKNTVLSSLSNFIDQIHSMPIVQQLQLSRDSIVRMFLNGMIVILSDYFKASVTLSDDEKNTALDHLRALSPMIGVGGAVVPAPSPDPSPAPTPVLQSRRVL